MEKQADDFRRGHRARLREKFMENPQITDAELLELLLTYAVPRIDVKPIVRGLLARFGSYSGVISATPTDLMRVRGVGRGIVVFICALYSGTLRGYVSAMKNSPVFNDWAILENYCKMRLATKTTEEFHILYLDNNSRLQEDELHAAGTIDHAVAYPREILKRALDLNSRFVILVHNHPNGSPLFSQDDIVLTRAVIEILKTVKITMHDHLLVAGGQLFSARAMNLI
ncbi:MAG: DNA repair protein RadC [Rickettsiales bacterium]|nr:DNA repair protein RadC [Rickettsiales bacterium]